MEENEAYRAGHFTKLGHREVAGDDVLSQSGVVLVFQIDEKRTNFRFVTGIGATVIGEDGLLDVLRTAENEIAR